MTGIANAANLLACPLACVDGKYQDAQIVDPDDARNYPACRDDRDMNNERVKVLQAETLLTQVQLFEVEFSFAIR